MNDNLRTTKNVAKFMLKDILPNYIVYNKKTKYAFCTACQKEVPLDFKHTKPMMKVKCPSCKKMAFLKSWGQINFEFGDSGVGIVLDKDGEDVVIRYYDVFKRYNTDGSLRSFKYHECLRQYVDETGVYETWNYPWSWGGWKLCNIRKHDTSVGRKGEPIIRINMNWKYKGYYVKNSVLKGTPWEHSCAEQIFKLPHDKQYNDVLQCFLHEYINCPVHEYLYKVGFKKLCSYATFDSILSVNANEKTLPAILGISKENYNALLKIGDPTYDDLLKRQRMSQFNLSESDYDIWIKYYEPKKWFYYSTAHDKSEDLMKKYYKKSWYQFDKYAKSQKDFKPDDYADYLRMCAEMNYDLKNTFIIFPKDFIFAEQNVTDEWNLKFQAESREKAKARNGEYEKYKQKYLKKYSFNEDNLSIVVPSGCDDICAEGQRLRHCVGTYIDKVCTGYSTILFVRQNSNLNKAYYTMEIVGKKITQVRGYRNKSVTDEVNAFVRDFAREKKLKYA